MPCGLSRWISSAIVLGSESCLASSRGACCEPVRDEPASASGKLVPEAM